MYRISWQKNAFLKSKFIFYFNYLTNASESFKNWIFLRNFYAICVLNKINEIPQLFGWSSKNRSTWLHSNWAGYSTCSCSDHRYFGISIWFGWYCFQVYFKTNYKLKRNSLHYLTHATIKKITLTLKFKMTETQLKYSIVLMTITKHKNDKKKIHTNCVGTNCKETR